MRSIHDPYKKGVCLECHKGHGNKTKKVLVTDAESLCFKCHPRSQYQEMSQQHPPAEKGECLTCHNAHSSSEKNLLHKRDGEICVTCHTEMEKVLRSFSVHLPFAAGECSRCHNPHGSNEKDLLLQSAQSGMLCFECHKDIDKKRENVHAHKPFVKGDCLSCHDPHGADNSFLILNDTGVLCLTCHQDVEKTMERANYIHGPERDLQCEICHQSHVTDEKKLLLKKQPDLCLNCHQDVATYLGISPTGDVMSKLRWLGLFSEEKIGLDVQTTAQVMTHLIRSKLALPPGGKDIVVLWHQIFAEYPNGNRHKERITHELVEYGDPQGFSSISRLVGLPLSIAVRLILNGTLNITGCLIPTHPAIYEAILPELTREGLKFKEIVTEAE